MSLLLVTIHHQVEAAKSQGQRMLSQQDLAAFEARYQAILAPDFADNPLPPPGQPPAKTRQRGRPRRSPPRNLLERLQAHSASVLRFMHGFTLPFDNNQAEQNLRMMKLKQKISGSFRSEDGVERCCRIRGYLATLRKQGLNVLDTFLNVFSGNPQSPIPQPE